MEEVLTPARFGGDPHHAFDLYDEYPPPVDNFRRPMSKPVMLTLVGGTSTDIHRQTRTYHGDFLWLRGACHAINHHTRARIGHSGRAADDNPLG
jgi:hypothetical protein